MAGGEAYTTTSHLLLGVQDQRLSGEQEQRLCVEQDQRLCVEQDQRLCVEQDQRPCGSTGNSSSRCQETETHMVRGMSHVTTASPKPSFRTSFGGRGSTPWLAREMLDGQCKRSSLRAGSQGVINFP